MSWNERGALAALPVAALCASPIGTRQTASAVPVDPVSACARPNRAWMSEGVPASAWADAARSGGHELNDGVHDAGQSFVDSVNQVRIEVLSRTGDNYVVRATLGQGGKA